MLLADLSSFRECLGAGRVVPYFQPIVEFRTRNLLGFEILARWRHPQEGLLSPDRFIPAVEEAGMIGEMTDSLLVQAAQSAAGWQAKPTLSLNLSPLELGDSSLPQRLSRAADAGGLPLDRLVLEITESTLIDDLASARSIIDELKSLGIRLALDDWGTGYSRLHYLQALPFDEVKIDAQFVKQLSQQHESRQIVTAMIGLGRGLGLATVAEGIEEEEQAEILASLGCELGQGWLFGRPVPAEEVPDVIARLSPRTSAGDDSIGIPLSPPETRSGRETMHEGSTHKQEYRKMISMLVETVASLSASDQLTVTPHLKRIEENLQQSSLIEDVRANRLLLGQCLDAIRERLERQESSVDSHHGQQTSKKSVNDPVTGLLSHEQAAVSLLEAVNSGRTYFVVPIVAKGADLIYSYHGREVGDALLHHFSVKLRSVLGEGDRLFRWHSAFLVLVAQETATEVRHRYSPLSNMQLEDVIQVGTRLMWIPAFASWDVIAVEPPYSSLVQRIDEFVGPRMLRTIQD
jgi:EAL domain-containing protein (putative c-di-GMP-specific phosphodiesterase class I)/GGDEF domain-containing protein